MSRSRSWAYDDLQVRIDRDSDGSYRTVATAPDGRTARGVFQMPLSDVELDEFVQRVGLVRRRGGPAEERLDAIKELGSSLFDALFADQVGTVYTAARAAASDGTRRLRITLRLSGAPELMRLPWEFLYHRPRFIAQSTDTPVVRTLDVVSARRAQKVTLPLRILGIISSPTGYHTSRCRVGAPEPGNCARATEGCRPGRTVLVGARDPERPRRPSVGPRRDPCHPLHRPRGVRRRERIRHPRAGNTRRSRRRRLRASDRCDAAGRAQPSTGGPQLV